ncbi:alanine racemase [Sporolituus thermophilus]|uniref:Alanine racemase n=1 Tax=Sporolituus thermophilus DSM 23256 TaxID=1123285 RepID=A0A1G7N7M1_9FIRM|nr:alanine racemase [Sporolituus thermophilus]SDF70065.1 alanine racemase [Sporolituus thermophilus DSM 23256]
MRPTHVQVDLGAIRHNITQIRRRLKPSTNLTAVVKANAYGHGAIPVSRAALAAGADSLAVALPEEGVQLRDAGFTVPILVLGLTLPEQASLLVEYDLTATVCTEDGLKALAHAARRTAKRARVMVKADTGMGRIGLTPDKLLPFLTTAAAMPEIELRGLFTHLATADAADKSYARRQLAAFTAILDQAAAAGISLPYISAANSATVIDIADGHFNTVRPGIAIYGLPPSPEMHQSLDLRPAMAFKTRIVYIKEVPAGFAVSYGCTYITPQATYLATLPVGYADGYSRDLSNKASVLIGGKRRPVVGRICMDQTIVDLGPVCDAAVGDEAVLFGRQGDAEITVTELAELAGTINYELVCGISGRVPRLYVNDGDER